MHLKCCGAEMTVCREANMAEKQLEYNGREPAGDLVALIHVRDHRQRYPAA